MATEGEGQGQGQEEVTTTAFFNFIHHQTETRASPACANNH